MSENKPRLHCLSRAKFHGCVPCTSPNLNESMQITYQNTGDPFWWAGPHWSSLEPTSRTSKIVGHLFEMEVYAKLTAA